MRRQREQVDAKRLHVQIEDSGGLHGVGVEDGLRVLLLDGAHGLGERLDRADLVVDVHDADEDRVAANSVLQLARVDEAFSVDAEIGDAEARFFEALSRVQDGVVLDRRGDDVVAAAGTAGGPGGAL